MATHGINLIDKDNARRMLFSLFKEVAHPRSPDTYEHLHKLRSANAIERNISLACYCARDERLTGTGGTHQKHAFGSARTHRDKARRELEKLYDFLKLDLRLLYACNIFKEHRRARFIEAFCF